MPKAMPKWRESNTLNNWFNSLFSGAIDEYAQTPEFEAKVLKDTGITDFKNTPLVDAAMGFSTDALKNTPLSSGHSGAIIKNAVKSHPFKTAGIVGGGLANIAGLTDNDKIGGQLIGAGIGTAIPWLLGANPSTKILAGLAGGTLGSLFDKLRASQEQDYNQNSYIQNN